MDQGEATLLAGAVAALVGVLGFAATQASSRRERRSQRFAEALLAMYEYRETPARIMRRAQADDSATQERLAEIHGRASHAVRYHLNLVRLESSLVAQAYEELFRYTHERAAVFRAWAWSRPPQRADVDLAANPPLAYEDDDHLQLCVACMRHELRWWRGRRQRRRLFARIADLRARRETAAAFTFGDVDALAAAAARKLEQRRGTASPSLPGTP